METYVQLRFSRSDGRSWTTGIAGIGENLVAEAREMAKRLVPSCDHIEVVLEKRDGALTIDSQVHAWSRRAGWVTK